MACGRNLSGVYTDLPMSRGTQRLLQELTRNGQSVWPKLSFLGQLFSLFGHFITPWKLEVLTESVGSQTFKGLVIYAATVYCDLGPKLGLGVSKYLASLGIESTEVRWSSSYKSISEVKGYSDWNYNRFFSQLVTLALSGPEETLILVW